MRSKIILKILNIPKILLTGLIAIIILFLVPIILLLSTPFFLYRYFICKFASRSGFRPLTTRSTILATDDIYNTPKCNILISVTVRGNIGIETLRKSISRSTINAKNPDGSLQYPELKQYISKWSGFYFFKNDPTFDISDHVKLPQFNNKSQDSKIAEENVEELRQSYTESRWDKKKPLWEVILVPNCYKKEDDGPYSTMFLRFHHSLSDGGSMLVLCIQGICQKPAVATAIPNLPKRSLMSKFRFLVTLPFLSAYEGASVLLTSRRECRNGLWMVRENSRDHKFHIDLAPKVSIKLMKEIKNHFKVSFSSVILSVMASAIRDCLGRKRVEIPDHIPCGFPLPVRNHTKKLRNEMTVGMVYLPLGPMSPEKRLGLCYKEYEKIKKSSIPQMFLIVPRIMGQYFTCIARKIGSNIYCTTGVSNFPGELEKLEVNGHPVVDIVFTGGLQLGISGLGFTIISYGDALRIAAVANISALSKIELCQVTSDILKHIQILHDIVVNENV